MPIMFGMARLGRDAEIRCTPNGDAVCNLSLAFNYGGKEKSTQWVDATLWGKRAEALAPYLLKGGAIVVTLSDVHIETFAARDGTQGHKMVGRIMEIELTGKADAAQGGSAPTRSAPPARTAPAAKPAAKSATGFDDMDDDIPF